VVDKVQFELDFLFEWLFDLFAHHLLVFCDFIVLKILNHFEDVSRLLSCKVEFHPVHDHSCRIDALYLLHVGPDDFTFLVTRRANADVVDVHFANDILGSKRGMLSRKLFIAEA